MWVPSTSYGHLGGTLREMKHMVQGGLGGPLELLLKDIPLGGLARGSFQTMHHAFLPANLVKASISPIMSQVLSLTVRIHRIPLDMRGAPYLLPTTYTVISTMYICRPLQVPLGNCSS
jgi:hypothetical protein